MAQAFWSPSRLVCNSKSSRWFSCKVKKADGLQLHTRHSHANRLDWHSCCIRSHAKPLHGGAHQKSLNALSASLTESKSYTNPDSKNSLATFEVSSDDESARMNKLIAEIKEMFESMEDGEISPSAYDTAWVARIPAIDGSGEPQFPQTLEWILHNQLPDGSWGEPPRFLLSDRILNTLSCLTALTRWNTGHIQVQRGLEFIRSHAESMGSEAIGNHGFLKGFQMVFPAILNEAKVLSLDLPDFDLSIMKQINQKRDFNLKRISAERLQTVPTAMLHYLEGIQEVVTDWQKILRMQSKDGSFLGSPASTACVYMHTGDNKCLKFLTGLLAKFEDHVPCMYPLDICERLRAVDTVERLGIERHFQTEIKRALDYVYSHWDDEKGIGFGRDSLFPDIDMTATGFRLLRMNGYDVSAEALENIRAEANLSGDQQIGGLFDILNLYRCSQINFPGEKVMEEINGLSKVHLAKSLEHKDLSQAQAIRENLREEIEYALDHPWDKTLPRLTTRNNVELFRSDDMWLGKTLYHMPYVGNDKYLELAKLDFNNLQALYRSEMSEISRWYEDSGLLQVSFTRHREAAIYFSAAVVVYEPEYTARRIAYAKAGVLTVILDDLYDFHASLDQIKLFNEAVKRWDPSIVECLPDEIKTCFMGLYNTLNDLGEEGQKAQARDVLPYLRSVYSDLLAAHTKEKEWSEEKCVPSLKQYMNNGRVSISLAATSLSTVFCGGYLLPEEMLEQLDFRSDFQCLVGLTGRLINDFRSYKIERDRGELASCIQCYMNDHPGCTEEEALDYMYHVNEEALAKLHYEFLKRGPIPKCYRELIFNTARIMQLFYMNSDGFRDSAEVMKEHVRKILFEPVQ